MHKGKNIKGKRNIDCLLTGSLGENVETANMHCLEPRQEQGLGVAQHVGRGYRVNERVEERSHPWGQEEEETPHFPPQCCCVTHIVKSCFKFMFMIFIFSRLLSIYLSTFNINYDVGHIYLEGEKEGK